MNKKLKFYSPIFIGPILVAFVIVFIIPFIQGVYLSFCDFTTVDNATPVGIKNYIKAFADQDFLNALWFTVKFTVVSVISVNVIAFFIALALTRKMRGSNFFRTVFFMPNLIGGIVLGYIWNLIINGVLGMFGVDITYNASYGFWGLVVLMNWQMIGYTMVIYIAGIQSIPASLTEASKIDGASYFQNLKSIIIPMIMPSVTICTFLTLSNSFKLFDQNLALTNGAPARQTSMLALDIYNTFYATVGEQGMGQAKAVIFTIIVAAIAFLQIKLTRSKEEQL